MTGKILIVGVGREAFGDDAAGLVAARRLEGVFDERVSVVADGNGGWSLLDSMEGYDLVVVIDAAESSDALPAGTWARLRYPAQAEALGKLRVRDSHTLGLEAVLRLAEAIGTDPAEFWVYALAGERFGPETPMSPAVESAVGRLTSRIAADVRRVFTSEPRTRPVRSACVV